MLGDLVGHLPRAARHLAGVCRSSTDADWALAHDFAADQVLLPLGVPVEFVQVGEHLRLRTVDLDGADDHGVLPVRLVVAQRAPRILAPGR